MSEKKLFWIGSGTFGIGKGAIKYGEEFTAKVDEKRLKKLISDKLVGEIKSPISEDKDKIINDLKSEIINLKKENEKLKQEIEKKSVEKKETKKKEDKK